MKKFLVEVTLSTEGFQAEDAMYDVSKALLDMKEDGIITDFSVTNIIENWKDKE